jgi:hypothetical protein
VSDSIRDYIARAPVAISGHRGHDTTLRIARTLYNGFALSRDQVVDWLCVYNSRLCEKWSDRELAHKADSAVRGTYDKPRGWLLTGNQFQPRRIAIRVPETSGRGQKIAKKYVLATDATVILHTTCHAHAHAHCVGVSGKSVASVAHSPKEDPEPRRIATELVKLQKDGVISGPVDPARRSAPTHAAAALPYR